MQYIDQFYSGLFPYTCFGTLKFHHQGFFSMLPDIQILKTKPQYTQYSVEQSYISQYPYTLDLERTGPTYHNTQEMTMEYRNYTSSYAK
jgi:hypothetical protein